MELLESSLVNFTEQLASPAAVPGGGGASALVGALGIALGDMVGELTVGKKKYADVEEEIRALMVRAQDLRVRLLACIAKDAEAFEPLSKAYGIPKIRRARTSLLIYFKRHSLIVTFFSFLKKTNMIELKKPVNPAV